MISFKKFITTITTLFIAFIVKAQNKASENQVDFMRSNGKIYVVMTVILIILTGFFIYLISLDRKISKMENSN
jgi:multisubunit Na+/H+ antiporter MnhB subunit